MTSSPRIRGTFAKIVDVKLLGRHQLAAAVGTGADFGSMIALVEIAKFSPPVATLLSAMVGGTVNFAVSRGWAFHARHTGTIRSQALRYGAVSLGGALVNAAALAVVLRSVAIAYPLARAAVSVAVGLLYTYPLHRRFVFRLGESARELPGAS